MRVTRSLAGLLLVAVSLVERGARADAKAESPENDPARVDARSLAKEGDVEFAAGRCDRAVPLWKRAESRFHAPTILIRIARCQALLGRVVDATATLEAIVAEDLGANPKDAFAEARAAATEDLPKLRARIATIELVVDSSGASAAATVTIDDVAMPRGQTRFPLDPGSHRVRVAAGEASFDQVVPLTDGEKRLVRVRIFSEARPVAVPTQRIVAYVLGGAGLATMAVGSVFGVLAVQDSHGLFGVCTSSGTHCPPDAQSRIDRLKTESVVADITIGGGAAIFLAGAVVLLTAPSSKREAPLLHIAPMGLGAQVVGAF